MTYKWLGILASLAIAFGSGWHFGRQGLELKAANAEVKQNEAQAAKRTTDQSTIAREATTYEAATDPLAPLPAPVVRLCYSPAAPAVPSTQPAGSGAHASPAVPAAAPADPVSGPDIGRPVLQVGVDANAQVAGLQDYIERVCQAKAP